MPHPQVAKRIRVARARGRVEGVGSQTTVMCELSAPVCRQKQRALGWAAMKISPRFASTWILASLALLCLMGRPRALAQNSPVYPQQEGYVDANGVMLYYVTFGNGEPLVIMHGGPGASHDYFLPYLLPLARHNRLIFLAERGSGRSQELEERSQHTVENMVEDLEAVRKGLNLGKII